MSDREPIPSDYIDPATLAAELKVTTRTLQRWQALRIGPPITSIGKRRVYLRDSVAAWLRFEDIKPPSRRVRQPFRNEIKNRGRS